MEMSGDSCTNASLTELALIGFGHSSKSLVRVLVSISSSPLIPFSPWEKPCCCLQGYHICTSDRPHAAQRR
jgi:hypothetical protein